MKTLGPSLAVAARSLLASGLLFLIVPRSTAAEGGFTATLSSSELIATGLASLDDSERATLDQLVRLDLAQVRQPDHPDLTGTFTSRLNPAQRQKAGLFRLSAAQLARLDERVASALDNLRQPKERPRLHADPAFTATRKPEIHGGASLTLGWAGGGRTFRATDFWLDYYDPASGLGLSVGYGETTGKGFHGFQPGFYDAGFFQPGSFSSPAWAPNPTDGYPFPDLDPTGLRPNRALNAWYRGFHGH